MERRNLEAATAREVSRLQVFTSGNDNCSISVPTLDRQHCTVPDHAGGSTYRKLLSSPSFFMHCSRPPTGDCEYDPSRCHVCRVMTRPKQSKLQRLPTPFMPWRKYILPAAVQYRAARYVHLFHQPSFTSSCSISYRVWSRSSVMLFFSYFVQSHMGRYKDVHMCASAVVVIVVSETQSRNGSLRTSNILFAIHFGY